MDRDSLQLLLAQGLSVEQIGRRFSRHPSTVSYWLRKHGLEAANRAKHAAKGGIDQGRLSQLVESGMTIAEIADEVGLSKGTVRHWLKRYGMTTKHHRGHRPGSQTGEAKRAGQLTIRMYCPHHGEAEFWLEGRGAYRCKRCGSDAVTRRRRLVKEMLVREAGGRCVICGYDRYLGSLQFHHLDPAMKRMARSARGVAFAIDRLREEAGKCVLLCSNCHAEVEGGIVELPLDLRVGPRADSRWSVARGPLHRNPG